MTEQVVLPLAYPLLDSAEELALPLPRLGASFPGQLGRRSETTGENIMAYESRRAQSLRVRLSFLTGTAICALWTGAAAAQTAPAPPAQPPANAPAPAQPVNTTQTPDQQTQAVPPG